MKSCLHWAGYVVRMDDSRFPKQLFNGEMSEGKRKASNSKKRLKDLLNICLRRFNISVVLWEKNGNGLKSVSVTD